MRAPKGSALGVREIARRVNLPYETVRRHAAELVEAGQCVSTKDGVAVEPSKLKSKAHHEMIRRVYLNAERMLVDLTRAGMAKFQPLPSRRGRLTREQMVVATIATDRLLAGIRIIGDYWNGDVLRALVFTAIWTANVKHVTNSAPAASQVVLADELRIPVSVLAISNSLRLPYETVRRHALALERQGICHRVGRQGLVVPGAVHRTFASRAVKTHELLTSLLVELRRAGVKA